MSDNSINIPVQVQDDSVPEAEGKFVALKTQIRETRVELQKLEAQGKENSKEFQDMANKLDTLEEAQERVAFQSKQMDDKLSAMPGPLGDVGRAMKSAGDAINQFGKGTAVALGVVGLIVTAFFAMKKALESTAEGQALLNRMSDAFQKVLGPVMAIVERVAVPVFTTLANIIEKVAGAFAFFAEKLGISKAKIAEASSGIKDFKKANEDLLKEQADKRKELQDKEKAAKDKREQDAEKHYQKMVAIEKAGLDAENAEYERQLKERDRIKEKLEKRLGTKNILDVAVGLDGMTDKERAAKEKADLAAKKHFQEKADKLTESMQKKQSEWSLKNTTTTLLKEGEARAKDAAKQSGLQKFLSDDQQDNINRRLIGVKAGLTLAGNLIDKNSAAGKALAIASTTIDTYQSAVAAYKAVVGIPVVGPALAPVAAGAAIAAGLLSIKQIVATKPPPVGDGSAAGGGVSVPSISMAIPQLNAPQIGGTVTNNNAQLAGMMGNAVGQNMNDRPIKAYVVSSDIKTADQFDRRVLAASKL